MFGLNQKREAALNKRITMLEVRCTKLLEVSHDLEDKNHTLETENKQLSQKRQMEEEMIAHKLKMREEQVELDATKKIATSEQKHAKKSSEDIAAVKDTYRDKLENQLEKRGDELKGMYKEVLTRLPDISMAITKDIKEKSKS